MSCNTVFIDTSLGTHLAMLVSDTETASNLKQRIVQEHRSCFPDIGEMKVSALKVKRRGHFYHLSDSMLVKRAFDGVSKSWFLFVDATWVEDTRVEENGGNGKQVFLPSNEVGLLHDRTSKWVPNRSGLNLPLLESDGRLEPKSFFQKFGEGNSDKEISKHSDKEAEHCATNHLDISIPGTHGRSDDATTINHHKVSTAAANGSSDPELLEKASDLATNSRFVDGNSRNDVRDVEGDSSLQGGMETETAEERKRKTKRKTRSENDHALDASRLPSVAEEPDISLNSVDKVSVDKERNKHIASEIPNKQSGIEGENASPQSEMIEAVEEAFQRENDANGRSLQEASASGPPVKKKRKVEKKHGKEDSSTGFADLILDTNKVASNLETLSSRSSLGNLQKDSKVNINQITSDSLERQHGLTASPSADKKKKKKKSSRDSSQVVAPISSSARDLMGESFGSLVVGSHGKDLVGEPDAAATPQQIEQIGIEMGDVNVVDEVSKNVAPSAAGNSTFAADNHELVVEEFKTPENIEDSVDQNVVSNDKNKTQTHKLARVEEEVEFPKNTNDEVTVGRLEGEIAADGVKSVKSSKKKKKFREIKDPVEGILVTSSVQQIEGSGVGVSSTKPKTIDGEEPDKVIRNVLESLQQSNENQEKSEKAEKKSRKKSKKKRRSGMVDGTEDNYAAQKDPTLSVDNVKKIDDSSKSSKKAKRTKESAMDQLNETNSEFKHDTDIESDNMRAEQNPKVAALSPEISHKFKGNNEAETSQGITQHDIVKGDHADETPKQVKGSYEKQMMNFDDNFGPSRIEDGSNADGKMLDQGVTDTGAAERLLKLKKSKKMPDLPPGGPVNGSKSTTKTKQNQGDRGKAQAASSSTSQLSSKVKIAGIVTPFNKEIQRISENGASGHRFDKIGKSLEAEKLDTLNASETRSHSKKKKDAQVASNSSLVSYRENIQPNGRAENRKSNVDQSDVSVRGAFMDNNRGIVKISHTSVIKSKAVNNTDRKRNLMPMSGSIFKDDNNWHSGDTGGDSSDASTRTPSDVSSDNSDDESDATFKSPQTGSSQGKENVQRNIANFSSSGPKDMSLEKILRSSSRYKKAKLTASQSQPDDVDDSLPFECVPDSQAN